jgi:hypothetical protein
MPASLSCKVASSSLERNAYLWDLLRQLKLLCDIDRPLLKRTLLICGLYLFAQIDCRLENSDVLVELNLQLDISALFNFFAEGPGGVDGAVFATRRGRSADLSHVCVGWRGLGIRLWRVWVYVEVLECKDV